MRWGPIQDCKKRARRPYVGPNARQKWEYKCSACGAWVMGKDSQVDHIAEAGTLRSFDDLPEFAERLFCELDGLRVLCTKCHEARRGATKKAKEQA